VYTGELKLAAAGKTTVVDVLIGKPKLAGTWKLDASLQYMDKFADMYGSGDAYRKERKNLEEGLKGRKTPLPDLVLDGMERLWKISKEGDYTVITAPAFDDPQSLGGSRYKIRFKNRTALEGTFEARGRVGGKENLTRFQIVGTRIK
jgi:hypothetical protein